MRRALVLVATLTALAGCEFASQTADAIARQQAKAVVNEVVADRLPGVNPAPVTDCIIDNASAAEIVTIAGDAVTGMTPATGRLVLRIARRPETVRCIASNGLGVVVI